MTSRRALWGLIVDSGLLRLTWAASIGPGNDEAYHYLFTVHPALSYFDHPPMLALIEAAGISMAGGSVSTFSLRLGFVLLFAGSTWLMARLTSRFYGDRGGLLAAFALNVSAYHTAAAGAFALPVRSWSEARLEAVHFPGCGQQGRFRDDMLRIAPTLPRS